MTKPIEFTGFGDPDHAHIVGYTASRDDENPQPEPQASNDTIMDNYSRYAEPKSQTNCDNKLRPQTGQALIMKSDPRTNEDDKF